MPSNIKRKQKPSLLLPGILLFLFLVFIVYSFSISSALKSKSRTISSWSSSLSNLSTLAAAGAAKLDTFFISHGSPTLSIDDGLAARQFLKSFQLKVYSTQPKAILMVSAHWDTPEPTVNAVSGTMKTIYDFYGFPKKMYKIKYHAPGAPELARRVKQLLLHAGFTHVNVDKSRGLDHGAWVPLMLMYPDANIPVCELSIQSNRDGLYHYNLGRALAPLMEEEVLIIGSGSATHNLRAIAPDNIAVPIWALQFDAWLKQTLLRGRHEDINQYEHKAPSAKLAQPWPDHMYPLHVALGAAGPDAKAELIHSSWSHSSLSYASFRFTTSN